MLSTCEASQHVRHAECCPPEKLLALGCSVQQLDISRTNISSDMHQDGLQAQHKLSRLCIAHSLVELTQVFDNLCADIEVVNFFKHTT